MTLLIIQWAMLYCMVIWYWRILTKSKWTVIEPDESITTIADILMQSNEIIQDLPFIQGDIMRIDVTSVSTSPTNIYAKISRGRD